MTNRTASARLDGRVGHFGLFGIGDFRVHTRHLGLIFAVATVLAFPGWLHAQGVAAKPEGCTQEFKPVCGCDFKTYSNDCMRRAAGAPLLWKGSCFLRPLDKGIKPELPKVCQTNSDCEARDYCAKPDGACHDEGRCRNRPEICTNIYDPVCGCDGVTYSNDCYAAAAGVNVLNEGSCGPKMSHRREIAEKISH